MTVIDFAHERMKRAAKSIAAAVAARVLSSGITDEKYLDDVIEDERARYFAAKK